MGYEPFECIDAGTEYCPCHLAETENCILCSQLQGYKCCDCPNWKGVCIYQEFFTNNFKAKGNRKYHSCKIIDKVDIEKKLIILTVEAPSYLIDNLVYPGSFVFMRHPDSAQCFDAPIAIMDINPKEKYFKVAIELKGVKTNKINELNEKDNILIKGPYWNGILGLKHVENCKDSTCLLIARGIGQAPMVPVLKKLKSNYNKLIVIVDKSKYEDIFIEEYLEKYYCKVHYCDTFDKGKLTIKFKELLIDTLINNDISLVHCDAADIINYHVMKIVEKVDKQKPGDINIKYACSNNAKMCCGDGVCGCCTITNNDDKLRRMCKLQTDPKYIYEGRRLL